MQRSSDATLPCHVTNTVDVAWHREEVASAPNGVSTSGVGIDIDGTAGGDATATAANVVTLLQEAMELVATGHYSKALSYLRQYLAECRGASGGAEGEEDPVGVGRAYRNIGVVYLKLQQPKKAVDFLTQGLARARVLGAVASEAKVLMHLGVAYTLQGQLDVALAFHNEALTKAEGIGATKVAAAATEHMAEILSKRGDFQRAHRLHRQSVEKAADIQDTEGVAIAEHMMEENRVKWNAYRRAKHAVRMRL